LDNKPLYVAIAQRRDVRRAQLEAQYAQRAAKGISAPQLLPPQSALFYQGMQGMPQRVLYPQQMVPRGGRWPAQGGTPQMMGVPARGLNYVMPLGGGEGRGRGVPGGRGTTPAGVSVGPGGRGGRGQPQARGGLTQAPRRPGGRGYQYTSNARNQQTPQMHATASPSLPVDSMAPTSEPLTIKTLAAAPEEQKKQMIGESLFPLVKEVQSELAGKITGMLLEMDNGELLHLLESREALTEKIDEALNVLQSHDHEDEEEE